MEPEGSLPCSQEPCDVDLCHHSMVCHCVMDGDYGLHVWWVAVNIMNKQSQTADKGWSSTLEVGQEVNNSSS
jgi:hypothetical protein